MSGVSVGIFSGAFGFGGGMIMLPMFFSMGVHPQVASATSCYLIMFGCIQTTVQFYLVG